MRHAHQLLSVLVGATLWACAGSAVAQEIGDVTRPCRRADLLGQWQVIRLGPATGLRVDRSDPAFFPHQQYVFGQDATVRHLTSQTLITDADHRALLAVAAAGMWAVDAAGRLLLLRAGQARLEKIACLVLVREVTDPKTHLRSLPGDILLTTADAADKPLYRRQLRRLVGPGE